MNSKKQFFARKRILIIALVLLLAAFLLFAFDSRLLIRRYSIEAEEIDTPIRIALVTDLHSCRYGENQNELIRTVTE